MERSSIKCLIKQDIRGFSLLDDEGMPFVTIEALRSNVEAATHISIVVEPDKRGIARQLSESDYVQLRPHVNAAIADLRQLVGDLPLQFQKWENDPSSLHCTNWIDATPI